MAEMIVAALNARKKKMTQPGTLGGFAQNLVSGKKLGESAKNLFVGRTTAGQLLMPDHAEKMDNTRIEGVLRTQLKGQGILGDEQDAIIKSLIDDDEEDAPYNTYVQKGILD
tara:strand:- start:50 stop:385 length:336 start_codon:yes stop_codon:yes gene_type:complete